MSDSKQHTVCIIGGGMSGLITGALLAKNGYKVTVLEKNQIIGGGLQSFVRDGVTFNTAMQGFAGYEDPFALGHLFRYLNVNGQSLGFTEVDNNAQEIVWTDRNHCYHLPKGRNAFEKYLVSKFPKQADGIHQLLDSIYEICSTYDYFWLHPILPHPEIIPYTKFTAKQLIQQYITDKELVKIFEYIGPHVGYNISALPSEELGIICNLYIEGCWRVAGGSNRIAKALVDCITNNGGMVYKGKEVDKVIKEDDRVKAVVTVDKERYCADKFLCAISPKILAGLVDGDVFRKSTVERITQFVNDTSCCNVYIKFNDQTFKYFNNFIFLPHPKPDAVLPKMIALITPPIENQGEWAKTMEIFLPIHYNEFKRWEHTKTGNRGEDYELYKQNIARDTIEYAAKYYPKIKQAIDKVYVSTPLTIRDYYGNPQGASYSQQGLFMPIRTKSKNLYMTGQAVQYQGLYGVAITSIMTAETILEKTLIEEIAKA